MYKEAQRHRAVLPVIAQHLVYCVALQFVSMRWVPFHSPATRARPCSAIPRRIDVSRPEKLLAHSSSLSQRLGFEVRSCYCVSFHRRARPCAAVRAQCPCASIRVHAVQCTPMRLLVGPVKNVDEFQMHGVRFRSAI